MLHNHNECHHSFSHCSTCDIVYCSKCNKEWKFTFGGITYAYPDWTYIPAYTPTIVSTHTSH